VGDLAVPGGGDGPAWLTSDVYKTQSGRLQAREAVKQGSS